MADLQPVATNIDQAGSKIDGTTHVDHGSFVVQGNLLSYNSIGRLADKEDVPLNSREACIRSLGFLEIDYREHDICAAVENTCDWLFRTTEFERWRTRTDLATSNGMLCIKGKPGAGKSTLMKHTLAHCKEIFPDHLIAAHFFNARGVALEKTPLGMLRSIVYQLIRQDDTLFEYFLSKFCDKQYRSQEGRWEWRLQELKSFLASAIKQGASKPLILLVDALDECNEVDMQDIVTFLESLSSIETCSGTIPRICLSRRHHPPLSTQRCLELTVENNKDHRKDIVTYVQAKLEKRDDEIEIEIERKADGIFMWVVLVVSLLNKAYLKGDVDEMWCILQQVPEELEEVFRLLLSKDNEDMAETVLLLQWVLFSQGSLEVAELFFAMKTGTAPTSTDRWSRWSATDENIMQKRINYLSRGLVEVRSGFKRKVQFIHLSVSDFLLRNKRLQTLDPNLEPDPVRASHYRLWVLCRSCIDRISTVKPKETYQELHHRYPFLGYAASCILYHAENALGGGSSPHQDDRIGKWLREDDRWFKWCIAFFNATGKCFGPFRLETHMHMRLLYTLSLYEYPGLVRSILGEKGADANVQGGQYGNALQAASFRGDEEIVSMLLKAGAEVNAQGGGYGNALQAASLDGHKGIVRMLLKEGAEVNAEGGEYGNALLAASLEGHEEIVRVLLKEGAECNAQDDMYGNALQAASYRGHEEIVRMLLKEGAEVNAQGGMYSSALQAASLEGHEEIVRVLLKEGAECNAQGDMYGNALQASSYRGHEEIVRMLLKEGAEVNAQGGMYSSALLAASLEGHEEIVRVLLKEGAECNAQGDMYGNALQASSYRGHEEIVRMLLKEGAEVNAQGGMHGNALQAALLGYKETVKLLLEEPVIIVQDGDFIAGLPADLLEYEEIVRVLLKEGAEVNAQDGDFSTGLQIASLIKHEEIVRVLLKEGAEANTKDSHENSPSQASSPKADAMATTCKERSMSEAVWTYVIPHSKTLWSGLVFAITGGLILGLMRGGRITFLVSETIRRSGIRSKK